MVATLQETLELGIGGTERVLDEVVELVVSPSADAAQLFKFMCQLEGTPDDKDNNRKYTSIMHMVGCGDQGTVITMSVRPADLVKLPEWLANMARVQKVEEEPLANGAFPSLPKKLGVLSRSSISLSKRMRVSLQEVARN